MTERTQAVAPHQRARKPVPERGGDRGRLLVIGTSPMSLLIAVAAGRRGYRVTVAERGDRFGGAWANDEVDGRLVDRACHLLEPRAPARRWIFDQLGEEPTPYPHPPAAVTPWNAIWPIQSRRYRLLELAMAGPAAVRHLVGALGGDRTEFRRVVGECKHDLSRLARRTARELLIGPSPAIGFGPEAFNRLRALTEVVVDEVRLGVNIDHVDQDRATGRFRAGVNGDAELFDHVVVPSGADVEVLVSGRPIGRRQFHFENHHLLFEADAGHRPLSYLGFMANTTVRRVVDVGPAPTVAAGHDSDPVAGRRRFLAHVRGSEVTADDVSRQLAGHGYIADTGSPVLVRNYRYTSTRTIFTDPLPDGLWAPDTYGDLTDNLAPLLSQGTDGVIRLDVPFAGPPRRGPKPVRTRTG